MKPLEFAILFFLAALWGSSALLTRFASEEMGVWLMTELRLLIGATAIMGYAWWRQGSLSLRSHWQHYLVMGVINAAAPISMAAFAATILPTGFANILFAPMPLFAAIIAAVWLKDHITPIQIVGCILGVIGVAVLVGWRSFDLDSRSIIGIMAAIGSSLLYALASSYTKRFFKGVSALDITVGQLLSASVFLLPLALAEIPAKMPSISTFAIIAVFGVLSTAVGFLLFFWLMGRVGPAKTQVVALIIPCFGVFTGWLFNNEAITWNVIAGLVIVLISVALVSNIRVGLPMPKHGVD
ncbi:MAG: DMT family transporter [Chloroflexi bacterium]|jgi:drug/metabolite transporter (DMT)-like permease|nr:DMT family transporter [Chloroflexota bacterium]